MDRDLWLRKKKKTHLWSMAYGVAEGQKKNRSMDRDLRLRKKKIIIYGLWPMAWPKAKIKICIWTLIYG